MAMQSEWRLQTEKLLSFTWLILTVLRWSTPSPTPSPMCISGNGNGILQC